MKKKTPVIGIKQSLGWDDNLGLVTGKRQLITDDFRRNLADLRVRSGNRREGEHMLVAQIPTIHVEKWAREGFDIIGDKSITAAQIVARLKAENLGDFIATTKKV